MSCGKRPSHSSRETPCDAFHGPLFISGVCHGDRMCSPQSGRVFVQSKLRLHPDRSQPSTAQKSHTQVDDKHANYPVTPRYPPRVRQMLHVLLFPSSVVSFRFVCFSAPCAEICTFPLVGFCPDSQQTNDCTETS